MANYSGLSTITVADPGWGNPRTIAVANLAASWGVNTIGILSAMLSTRQANLAGIDDFKGKWVRWDHHTMGAWFGICTADPADLGVGTVELSCQSMAWLLKKRRTGFRANPTPSPPGSLVYRAFADANWDRDIPFTLVADEDGAPITAEWRGDDLFDLVDNLASSSGYEYVTTIDDDNAMTFAFRRNAGRDQRGVVLLHEGRDVIDGTISPDISDMVNDILAVSSDDQWSAVDRTVVVDTDSRDAYGALQERREYDYAVRSSSLRTRAQQDLATSALPTIPVSLRLRDRHPALANLSDGDTIRFGCNSKNHYYEVRVTSRSVDINDGAATLGGFATEAD